MNSSKNSISIDLTDNAELRDVFAGKNVGETCELTVKFQVNRNDPTTVEGTIESVTPSHGYSGDEDSGETKEAMPDREHPVAIVMAVGESKDSKREKAGAASY